MKKILSKKHFALLFTVIFASFLWVFFALTPSHYAAALQMVGVDVQPLIGQAKSVRSDELGVLTPLFQQAVLNNFQRYSEVGVTREDLRGFWGLPLKDWAIFFKPYLWGFFFLPPANAFSLYYLTLTMAFLGGMGIFLHFIGLPTISAFLVSLILFFSHHNQAWWGSNAACLSLTVWIVLPLFLQKRSLIITIASFLTTAAALLGQLYPAWQISQVFIFASLIIAFRPDLLKGKRLASWMIGVLIGVMVTYSYLADIIPVMANTVYPGKALTESGGQSLSRLYYNLFPHFSSRPNFEIAFSQLTTNICEEGTVSSWLLLVGISFVNYRDILAFFKKNSIATAVIFISLLFICLRMYCKLPIPLENLFFFNKVSSNRSLLAFGTLLTIFISIIFVNSPIKFSFARIVFFCVVGILGQGLTASFLHISLDILDFSFLLFPLILESSKHWSIFKVEKDSRYYINVSLAIILLLNFLMFGNFNVIQSANEVFSQERWNNVTIFLNQIKVPHNRTIVGVEGGYADILTGLGLPTPARVYKIPMNAIEQQKIGGDLPASELIRIFNRYHHVIPSTNIFYPKVLQADAIEVPLQFYANPVIDQEKDRTSGRSKEQATYSLHDAVLMSSIYSDKANSDLSRPSNPRNIAFYKIVNLGNSLASLKVNQAESIPEKRRNEKRTVRAMYFLDRQDLSKMLNNKTKETLSSSHIAIFVENYTTLSNSEDIILNDGVREYRLPRPPAIRTVQNISTIKKSSIGSLDQVDVNLREGRVSLDGWIQPLSRWETGDSFTIQSNMPFDYFKLYPIKRKDVADAMGEDYQSSRFNIQIEPPKGLTDKIKSPCLYVFKGKQYYTVKGANQFNCS
jgi:hypothetical protein